jgi:hypothetical protein
MKVAVVLGVVAAALSISIGALPVAALMMVGTASAGFLYWLAPQYPSLFGAERESDTASNRTVVPSLFDLAVFCLASAGLAFAWSGLGWVEASALMAIPEATPTTTLIALVGVFIGGAVPLLAERDVAFHQFEGPVQGETVEHVQRMGAAVLLLLVAPGALLEFLAVFIVSRLAVLCWWQTAGQ